MTEQSASAVQFKTAVPLVCEVLADDHDHNLILDDGIQMLQSLGALEEARTDVAEDDTAIHAEFRRLDSKLDLLLRLFGQTLRAQIALPPVTPMVLGRLGVSFRCPAKLPGPGENVLVEMYLSKALPLPLRMTGKLVGHHQAEDGSWADVEFDSSSQVLRDELNRFIFRHHRRAVAQTRRARDHDV